MAKKTISEILGVNYLKNNIVYIRKHFYGDGIFVELNEDIVEKMTNFELYDIYLPCCVFIMSLNGFMLPNDVKRFQENVKNNGFEAYTVLEKCWEVFNALTGYFNYCADIGEGREKGQETRILYSVEIPDNNGDNYIFWEKSIDEKEINILMQFYDKKYNYKLS